MGRTKILSIIQPGNINHTPGEYSQSTDSGPFRISDSTTPNEDITVGSSQKENIEEPTEVSKGTTSSYGYAPLSDDKSGLEGANRYLHNRSDISENAKKAVIAQLGLESGWGTTDRSKEHYNYGNITKGSNWDGSFEKGGDHDAYGNKITQNFRVYNSPEEGMEDFLKVLKRTYPNAYKELLNDNFDINRYMDGLLHGKYRYAEDPNYADSVIKVFNNLNNQTPIRKTGGIIYNTTKNNFTMKRSWTETYGKQNTQRTQTFQMGGGMAPEPGMEPGMDPGMETGMEDPGMEGGGDLEAMLAEFAQTQDPQLAVAICNMLLELMQGGAPAGADGMSMPGYQGGMAGGHPMAGGMQPRMATGGNMSMPQVARNGAKLRQGPVFKK